MLAPSLRILVLQRLCGIASSNLNRRWVAPWDLAPPDSISCELNPNLGSPWDPIPPCPYTPRSSHGFSTPPFSHLKDLTPPELNIEDLTHHGSISKDLSPPGELESPWAVRPYSVFSPTTMADPAAVSAAPQQERPSALIAAAPVNPICTLL